LCGSENKQRLFPYTALTDLFFGVLAKLPKAIIIFMFVLPSVRPSARKEQLGSHRTDFLEI
jgi:hypothetical protein